MSGPPDSPFIRITRGQPDDVEVAALTTVILALSALASTTERVRRNPVQRHTLARAALPAGSWRTGGD